MPSFEVFKQRNNIYNGLKHKRNSEDIMNSTWWEDIASRQVYLFDYFHDPSPLQANNINLEAVKDSYVAIDAKFFMHEKQSYSKDEVTCHIQFRPQQECNVDYYDEVLGKKYNADFPVGLYCLIPDANGIYNKWLIVAKANYNVLMFRTFEVLPCDYLFQWVYDNKKFQMLGCLRSQSSYTSGVWRDYKTETGNDVQKFAIPLNTYTENLFYNQRLIIDAKVSTEPKAWRVSKVVRTSTLGIAIFTLAQDKFDQHKDYVERDDLGNIIGMWADYYNSALPPVEEKKEARPGVSADIKYIGGKKPQLKVYGNYKKFETLFKRNDEPIDSPNGEWWFSMPIDGSDEFLAKYEDLEDKEHEELTVYTYGKMLNDGTTEGLIKVIYPTDDTTLLSNQIKVKFIGDDKYLGELLTIKFVSEFGEETEIKVEITSL